MGQISRWERANIESMNNTLFKESGALTTNGTTIKSSRISSTVWTAQMATAVDASLAIHRTIDVIKAYEKIAAMSPEQLKAFIQNQ